MEIPVKTRPVNIIVIDDEFDYCEQLKSDGLKYNLLITHFQNFEDGFKSLDENKKYKALILDGRCILKNDMAPGTGKTNFVFHSINRLHHLELESNRYLPYCVNTYEPESFTENLEGITKIFLKKEEHQIMFEYLLLKIEESEETQIKHKYDDVFNFINLYFDEDDEDLMLELLVNTEEKNSTSVITNFGILRRLEEKLFDVIAENYLGNSGEHYRGSRFGRTKGIIFHLKSNQMIPKYLYNFAMDIYNITSKYGNHNPKTELEKNPHIPGNYTVQCLSNSLM
ncbi:hypothetical protein ACFLRG_03920, partial [Bacteroidota bacterium]